MKISNNDLYFEGDGKSRGETGKFYRYRKNNTPFPSEYDEVTEEVFDEASKKENVTHTRGNVIVENIEVGDIHFDYEYGFCFKTKVIEKPVKDDNGDWIWKSQSVNTEKIVPYFVSATHSHYAPNLYDYEAYNGTISFD